MSVSASVPEGVCVCVSRLVSVGVFNAQWDQLMNKKGESTGHKGLEKKKCFRFFQRLSKGVLVVLV